VAYSSSASPTGIKAAEEQLLSTGYKPTEINMFGD